MVLQANFNKTSVSLNSGTQEKRLIRVGKDFVEKKL